MTQPPVTIVTGSSRGIGLQIARTLGESGHRIVMVARDATRLEEAQDLLERKGIAVSTVAADLTDPEASERIVEAARSAFGEPTVLVNNAGTAPTAKAEATTDAILTETYTLHVMAPARLIRACLPAMKNQDAGCIVQLASTAGLRGYPFTTAYTAAKHGMVGYTRALAAELANTSVAIYAVCPGFVDSDIADLAFCHLVLFA